MGNNTGLIVGIIVGIIAVALLALGLYWFFLHKKAKEAGVKPSFNNFFGRKSVNRENVLDGINSPPGDNDTEPLLNEQTE